VVIKPRYMMDVEMASEPPRNPPSTPANDMENPITSRRSERDQDKDDSGLAVAPPPQGADAVDATPVKRAQLNPLVYVCPLSLVPFAVQRHQPSHLVTLIDPEVAVKTPQGILPERHLRLGLHDIASQRPDMTHPIGDHVEQLLGFVSKWDHQSPLLIHCYAGISRSTAAAFITMCSFNPPGHEHEIAWALRVRAPHAQPNRLIVALADEMLGRRGRMIRAIDAIGPGQVVFEGDIFSVPLRPGI
jgi:predicted protein tyrosine phosphatase